MTGDRSGLHPGCVPLYGDGQEVRKVGAADPAARLEANGIAQVFGLSRRCLDIGRGNLITGRWRDERPGGTIEVLSTNRRGHGRLARGGDSARQ